MRPNRRNWFPSEKVSAVASTGIGALGTAGMATHQLTGSTESTIISAAGFGFAVLALAKDKYERQKKKNADRPEGQCPVPRDAGIRHLQRDDALLSGTQEEPRRSARSVMRISSHWPST